MRKILQQAREYIPKKKKSKTVQYYSEDDSTSEEDLSIEVSSDEKESWYFKCICGEEGMNYNGIYFF